MNNVYFVYVLRNESDVPFYVGKGKRKRDSFHIWNAKYGAKGHLYNLIRKMLSNNEQIIIERLVENLSNENACEIEKEFIKKFGKRCNGGTLVNIKDGGQTPKDYKHDNNAIEKMRIAWTKRGPVSDETKKKISKSNKGKTVPIERREKISKSISGEKHWNFGKTITKEHANALHSARRIKVNINGVIFESIAAAAKALNLHERTVAYRIKSIEKKVKKRGKDIGVWEYA